MQVVIMETDIYARGYFCITGHQCLLLQKLALIMGIITTKLVLVLGLIIAGD